MGIRKCRNVPMASEAAKKAARDSGLDVVWHLRGGELVPFVPLTDHPQRAVDHSEVERLTEMAEDEWTQATDADRAGDEEAAEEHRDAARELEHRVVSEQEGS